MCDQILVNFWPKFEQKPCQYHIEYTLISRLFLDKLLERLLTRNWRILLSFVLEFACCQIPWFFCRNLEFCPKLIKLHNFRYNIYLKLYFWTKIPEHFINSELADSLKVLDQIPWVFRRISWVFLEERFFVLKWKKRGWVGGIDSFCKIPWVFFLNISSSFLPLGFFFGRPKKAWYPQTLLFSWYCYLVLSFTKNIYQEGFFVFNGKRKCYYANNWTNAGVF